MKTYKPSLPIIILAIYCSAAISGCSEYLDLKPNKRFATLESLDILQGTLDYYADINNRDAAAAEISADNYYLPDDVFNAMTDENRRMYTWEKDYFIPASTNDWSFVYQRVYAANSVLDNISSISRTTSNAERWDDIKGQALYIRGKAFLEAVGIWSLAYDDIGSASDLGIPLRLEADINVPSTRASVAESYEQVLADLREASLRLPETAVHVMRPSKAAAWALLARTYLFMRKYDLSLKYADSCLAAHGKLMDYNELDEMASAPIPLYNEEVIYYSQMGNPNHVSNNWAKIDTVLLSMYGPEDLRKGIFFATNSDGSTTFKGSYASRGQFNGVSTSEVYLTLSECHARLGDTEQALTYLNRLLEKRYASGSNFPTAAIAEEEVLPLILNERRKELLMRGIRWMDIKRLNKEGAQIGLKRIVNGELYELSPNHNRFALPLPEAVVELTGMPQNPR